MYEALRDEGASREKTAQISNGAASSCSHLARHGGQAADYQHWSKNKMIGHARELGITQPIPDGRTHPDPHPAPPLTRPPSSPDGRTVGR